MCCQNAASDGGSLTREESFDKANLTLSLPVAHSLTGCDTTSSFFGIGKKTVYKTRKQNTTKYQTLTNLATADARTR
jgi:hypothetical protein